MIEFRWIALIALWTMLIGPVCDAPINSSSAPSAKTPPAKTLRR